MDADWATSSEPVLAFSDGTVRVCDLYLNCTTTAVKLVDAFMPALWPSKNGIALKNAILFSDLDTVKWNETETEVEAVNVEGELSSELGRLLNFVPSGELKRICKLSTMEKCINVAR